MENILGSHILIEAYDCDPEILDDIKVVEETMVNAALRAGAEVREVAFHKFSPQGVQRCSSDIRISPICSYLA